MIDIRNLSKRYASRFFGSHESSTGRIVLDNLNLQIAPGEKVGILGRNGSGKTTLLRLISGSLQPTSGEIKIDGSVYPLMATGYGINESFSGRANIESSLLYCGITLDQEKLAAIEEDIEEFAELGDFFDMPMSSYSLGMKMRLVFGIATAIDPEILLIDEVLGAGDAYFVMKCHDRLRNLIEKNASILLLVSHSTQQLRQFCQRGIWLKDGHIILDGDINEVCTAYEAYIDCLSLGKDDSQITSKQHLTTILENGREAYEVCNHDDNIYITNFETHLDHEKPYFAITLHSPESIKKEVRILITFWGDDGRRMGRFENDFNTIDFTENNKQYLKLFPDHRILSFGNIKITVTIYEKGPGELRRIAGISNIADITTKTRHAEMANLLPHRWE